MSKYVTSVAEFVSVVGDIHSRWRIQERTTGAWFRGQANASWPLLPGLYRGKIDSLFERELMRDFSLYSRPLLRDTNSNVLEQMFVMQHYGLPTRLLDWTEGYLVALYFAVTDYISDHDAAVFVLDPWRLNSAAIKHRSVPTIQYPGLSRYSLGDPHVRVARQVKANMPVAVRPPHNSERIRAQSGVFTIHGQDRHPLEHFKQAGIEKVVVSGAHRKQILRDLVRAGISPKVLFPDLGGLCQDIALRYAEDFGFDLTSLTRSRPLSSARPLDIRMTGKGLSLRRRRPRIRTFRRGRAAYTDATRPASVPHKRK